MFLKSYQVNAWVQIWAKIRLTKYHSIVIWPNTGLWLAETSTPGTEVVPRVLQSIPKVPLIYFLFWLASNFFCLINSWYKSQFRTLNGQVRWGKNSPNVFHIGTKLICDYNWRHPRWKSYISFIIGIFLPKKLSSDQLILSASKE